MTDLERFVELYNSFGIDLKVEEDNADNTLYVTLNVDGDKFKGYIGCGSDAIFDRDGKFISQGFWE